MAPTICSEKEYRSRNPVRKSIRKQSSNNNNSSNSNAVINYVEKKTNGRSIRARNSKSMRLSIKYKNEFTICNGNDSIIVDNNYQHQNSRHSDNLLSIRNKNYDKIDENCNINIINDNIPSSSSSSSILLLSPTSSSIICDRLTPNQYLNRNLTENNNKNINNLYSYQKQSKLIYRNNSITYDDRLSSLQQQQSSQTTTRLNCTPSEISSTVCMDDISDDDIKINKIFNHKQQSLYMKNNDKNHKLTTNSKGLVDIALKTIILIKRNQLLQKKLLQLQVETKEFLQSVMSNPENREFCNKQLIEQSSQNDIK